MSKENFPAPRLALQFLCQFLTAFSWLFISDAARGDLIPPGHKSIKHELVFLDSPLLREHRLIAAPVRGFGGFAEVKADQPFYFSTKYGTKIYAVPKDFEPPESYTHGEALPFPNSEPPTHSLTSVSILRKTNRIVTRCRLTAITDQSLEIEVVEEVQFDEFNQVTTGGLSRFGKISVSLIGLVGCFVLWTLKKIYGRRDPLTDNAPDGTGESADNYQISE